ncbi:acylphosphatase [Variovorax sp. JS1663]|uniref:acylphosphatase n=1 Tax=Variovorax sp. JS1663 TaxID=1851577 RepID=UPI001864C93A|nr:acylphosphatase [Variovorax sp. JS1663]
MDARNGNVAEEARLVRVRGVVQGVGFRENCVRYARRHGIAGWVRNRHDGSVEALLQGAPQQLAQMCAWLRAGVPGARVDALEVEAAGVPSPRLEGFGRLPTM